MKVLKFGGTSVRDADRIRVVAGLVEEQHLSSNVAVVVSALGGATDELVLAARTAASRFDRAEELIQRLEERHQQTLLGTADDADQESLAAEQRERFCELRETMRGISLIQECSQKTLDKVVSHGELLSAPLVAAALRRRGLDAEFCDARTLILTDGSHGGAQVEAKETAQRIRAHFSSTRAIQVVTGFIASTPEGLTTTLGRGGSDLTASLLGAALDAEEIQIWTDVDGVMSADPRLVPQAFSLDQLSYEELLELSHFGAKVVFPPTVGPARRAGIPLLIKNTLKPDLRGTRVVEEPPPATSRPVTGIASINNVTLLRLEGDGMLAVPGIAGRLFTALARAEVGVTLISQASSAHSICFAIAPELTEEARAAIEGEFALELQVGLIRHPIVEAGQSVVAVVGEGMRERPGMSGRLFAELGRHNVNVRAITQGSSELNISLVVCRADEQTAVRVVHDSFFGDLDQRLELVIAGVGRIGSELLAQVGELHGADLGLSLSVTGVLSSKWQWLERRGVDLDRRDDARWRSLLEQRGVPIDLDQVRDFVRKGAGQRVFVDCTASDEMTPLYLDLMSQGAQIVSANKLPFAGPLEDYRRLRRARRAFGRGLYYEATVGAGLPVLRTLRSLVDAGDRLVRLEGAFSGTLGLLLSALRNGRRFSDALREAYDSGYTEPDPREDLSGRDVARKLLILARDAGWPLEPDQVELEPFVEVDQGLPLERLWNQLEAADHKLAARQREAQARGQVLAYRAWLEEGRARVRLECVEADHPLAMVDGTDNLFALHTERYAHAPLVIRGPGAGTEVTAGGVLADLLQAHAESSPAVPLARPKARARPQRGRQDSAQVSKESQVG